MAMAASARATEPSLNDICDRQTVAVMRRVLVALFFLLPVPAFAGQVTEVLGCTGDPCTVTESRGGNLIRFEHAADAIIQGARGKVVIDGLCASACMVLADLAWPKVCLTGNAVLQYHATSKGRPLFHEGDLHDWVELNGGYPAFDGEPATLPPEIADGFWLRCE